jgi:hypothetical protein
MLSSVNINYVEDIISLNILKIKESGLNLDQENNDIMDRTYHTHQVK